MTIFLPGKNLHKKYYSYKIKFILFKLLFLIYRLRSNYRIKKTVLNNSRYIYL